VSLPGGGSGYEKRNDDFSNAFGEDIEIKIDSSFELNTKSGANSLKKNDDNTGAVNNSSQNYGGI
jgi:hypothetical protein